MTKVAGVLAFKAKAGKGAELAQRIAAAKPHVEKEQGTLTWLVLHSNADPETVFLVDVFADSPSLDAHMAGDAARQILGSVPELLAEEISMHPSAIVSAKGA